MLVKSRQVGLIQCDREAQGHELPAVGMPRQLQADPLSGGLVHLFWLMRQQDDFVFQPSSRQSAG